jgi:hypothetical protein
MRSSNLWQGVVGYWSATAGPTGYRLLDRSGRGNHGTLTNMDAATDWVVDGGRYALDFDGSNDYAFNETIGFPNAGTQLTASLWIKWNATQADFRIPFGIGADVQGGNRGYFIWRSNSGFVRSEFGSSTGSALSATTTANNVWVNVVGRYDGATNKLFLDGVEVASVNYNSANFDQLSRFSLGGIFSIGAYQYFTNCRIAECVLWSRPLSFGEIRQLYQIGRGGMLTPRRRRRAYSVATGLRRRLLLTGQV